MNRQKTLFLIIFLISFNACALLPKDPYMKSPFETSVDYNQRMSGTYLAKQAQMVEEHQRIMTLYRKCLEENYGNPEAIKMKCDPFITPLRINAEMSSSPKGKQIDS